MIGCKESRFGLNWQGEAVLNLFTSAQIDGYFSVEVGEKNRHNDHNETCHGKYLKPDMAKIILGTSKILNN